ncbi:Sulfate adenylyltransferase [Venturia nashicola]|uniref:Sulfate adenylyltransferase n=1 Tax=Venturia nashicola TaxID=86259 RepID=A0A4Z1NMH1_9PEZI|nr:Sulfate adenylyltransferase [Venturia nashicola]TLD25967.1 Sulfate adenylyltransferase [Venturia nashicola]
MSADNPQFAFVIPLGVRPNQCFDEITPNNMHTSLTCAFSGACIVMGGLAVTVWIFVRGLSMHLQICWDIVPGQTYFYVSQVAGWGLTVVLFSVTMTITGVSFRFGDACHVNAHQAMASFWGPLLGLASAAGCVQIMTFLYCGRVYLREVFRHDRPDTDFSSGLPSYQASSLRATSARAVWQRVQKVLGLQWRSIMIIVFLLVDIIFLAIVWVRLDRAIYAAKSGKIEQFLPFLTCLAANASMRGKCFHYGQEALVSESVAIASLMLLSLSGVQTGLMMSTPSMFVGWFELFLAKFGGKREFVSLDAQRYSQDARTFELIKAGESPRTAQTDTPDSSDTYKQGSATAYETPDSAHSERAYRPHNLSFSGPRPPCSRGGPATDWPTTEEISARGGLRSHPPSPSNSSPSPRGNPPSPPLPPPPILTNPPQNR